PPDEVVRVADQATTAGLQCDDPYQRAASLAWPIRALAERGMIAKSGELLSAALVASDRIPYPVRRAGALFLIAQAAWPLGRLSREPVVRALLDTCRRAHSWRAGMIVNDLALMVSGEDREGAEEIASVLPEGRYRQRCLRSLSAGKTRHPRAFF